MEADTSNEGVLMEGNVPTESGPSGRGQTGSGQEETPGAGDTTPTLNPTAATITPRPASPHPSTPPSLERLASELKALKASGRSNTQRLEVLRDQRRQLLSHMASAKSEIDGLEARLGRGESVEGSRDVLNRLEELNEFYGWVGIKWRGLGEEVWDLEGEMGMLEG
ncbi:hypothetical protein BDR22DRAFT_861971 [Usnea florida]